MDIATKLESTILNPKRESAQVEYIRVVFCHACLLILYIIYLSTQYKSSEPLICADGAKFINIDQINIITEFKGIESCSNLEHSLSLSQPWSATKGGNPY